MEKRYIENRLIQLKKQKEKLENEQNGLLKEKEKLQDKKDKAKYFLEWKKRQPASLIGRYHTGCIRKHSFGSFHFKGNCGHNYHFELEGTDDMHRYFHNEFGWNLERELNNFMYDKIIEFYKTKILTSATLAVGLMSIENIDLTKFSKSKQIIVKKELEEEAEKVFDKFSLKELKKVYENSEIYSTKILHKYLKKKGVFKEVQQNHKLL